MHARSRKLNLHRETIRRLNDAQLIRIRGGLMQYTEGLQCSFSCLWNSHCCSGHFSCGSNCV